MMPLLPIVLASVAAGAGYLGWRFYQQSPWSAQIQYPLVSKIAYPMTSAQRAEAEEAERAMRDMGIPASIGAAMFANAWSESKFLNDAIGDDGASVGFWQILDRGKIGQNYIDLNDRGDTYTATVAMVKFMADNQGTATLSGASSPTAIPDPLTMYEQGGRDLGDLTASFMQHVERPAWSQAGEDRRREHVALMFPIRAVFS